MTPTSLADAPVGRDPTPYCYESVSLSSNGKGWLAGDGGTSDGERVRSAPRRAPADEGTRPPLTGRGGARLAAAVPGLAEDAGGIGGGLGSALHAQLCEQARDV